jgi:hypothetical protein
MLVIGVKQKDFHYRWVYIEDALQGNIKGIRCPFCDTSLIARKATKDKAAYFSHRKRACRYVRILRKSIHQLPILDYWLYDLSTVELRLFNRLRRKRDLLDNDTFLSFRKTESMVLVLGKENPFFGYEQLGKEKYDTVEKLLNRQLVKIAYHEFGVDVFKISWKSKLLWAKDWSLKKMYLQLQDYWKDWSYQNRWSWSDSTVKGLFAEMGKRNKRAYFYLLEIQLDKQVLHKVGTTMLDYEKLEKWEKRQLKGYGKKIKISCVYYVDSIALVESCIRLKYKKYRFPIGYEKGYFDFKNKFKDFKTDLHQVTLLSNQHRERIKEGLKSAKNVGKRGKESTSQFLEKEKNKRIISFLETESASYSLREIAFQVNCSVNTVRKVKRLWEEQKKGDL